MAHCRILRRAVPIDTLPFLTPRLWLQPTRTPTLSPQLAPPFFDPATQLRCYASTTRPPKIGRAEKPPKPPVPRRVRRNHAPPLPPKGNKAIALQPPAPPPIPSPATLSVQGKGKLDPSVFDNINLILLQPPYYITVHIHGFPYLVTVGDTITLPSLLYQPQKTSSSSGKPAPSVLCKPGESLRLTHASTVGSRDFTIKGAPYVDGRLFTCRARVVEITGEPMRIKEKTKRRQRRVKTVKSKHRYTVLKICELEVMRPPSEAHSEKAVMAVTGESNETMDRPVIQ